jgi:hypothetical protein
MMPVMGILVAAVLLRALGEAGEEKWPVWEAWREGRQRRPRLGEGEPRQLLADELERDEARRMPLLESEEWEEGAGKAWRRSGEGDLDGLEEGQGAGRGEGVRDGVGEGLGSGGGTALRWPGGCRMSRLSS